MPNQEKTPKKSFRPPPELWRRFLAVCREQGTTGTAVLVHSMANYIRRHGK